MSVRGQECPNCGAQTIPLAFVSQRRVDILLTALRQLVAGDHSFRRPAGRIAREALTEYEYRGRANEPTPADEVHDYSDPHDPWGLP